MQARLARVFTATMLKTDYMLGEYHRQDILETLYKRCLSVCENVYPDRPSSARPSMDKFVVIRIPSGVKPYADTHDTCTIQFVCYVRDFQDGVENIPSVDSLVSGLLSMFPFEDELLSCKSRPLVLGSKSDGMGFHSVIIQFQTLVKI